MAVVYKAYDTRLEREVAIKFLRTELFGEAVLEQLYRRFEREAKALARLSHFHIVKIYDYGEHEDTPYLVMEYIPGGTLKAMIGKPLPWKKAVELLLPIARALEYAHQRNVLHRDIKPSNVLITEGGEPLLTDFGIAKILDQGEAQAITRTGTGIGTPEYMAPEQGLAQPVDARTDVYALGVVLYEMLTGRKPYTADTPTAVLIKQIHDPLPGPREIVPDLPVEVERVLFKALAKQPEFRYASMGEMIKALENLLRPPVEDAPSTTIAAEWRPDVPKAGAEVSSAAVSKPAGAEPGPTVIFDKQPKQTAAAPASPSPPPAQAEPGAGKAEVPLPAAEIKPGRKWWIFLPVLAVIAAAVFLADLFNQPKEILPTPLPTLAPVTPVPTARPEPTMQPVVEQFQGVLKIGVLAPLSGNVQQYGVSTENGVQLAVEQWKQRGGALGLRIEAIFIDDQCTHDGGARAVAELIDKERVDFLIGGVCSEAAIPEAEFANERGVVQVVTAATNPAVTLRENGETRPFTFRACLVDPFQGLVAARFAYHTMGARRMVVVYQEGNAYETQLMESFSAHFKELGGEQVRTMSYAPGTENFQPILDAIKAEQADLIYLPVYYPVANQFVGQARERGISTSVIGADGWDSPELDLKKTIGSFFTTHYWTFDPRPEVVDFRALYGEMYHTDSGDPLVPDSIAALAYDATNLLLNAIVEANSTNPEDVRAALERITFHGVTGRLYFDGQHNPIKPAVVLAIKEQGVVFEELVMP
jgi:branched-chain amino acid transport system substrate-binding protein